MRLKSFAGVLLPILSPFSFALLFASTEAAADEPTIEGKWLTADEDGWIEIQLEENRPIGIIAGSPDDPNHEKPQRKDSENPDPALRDRLLLGITIMQGFCPGRQRQVEGRQYLRPQ